MQYNYDVFFHKIYWYSSAIVNLLMYNHIAVDKYLTTGLTIRRWFKDYLCISKSQNEVMLMINVWQTVNTIYSNTVVTFIYGEILLNSDKSDTMIHELYKYVWFINMNTNNLEIASWM